MSPETSKQIQWADHDRMWAPQKQHQGPWQIYQPKPTAPRLVWAYKREVRDGIPYEEMSYAGELK